MNTPPEPGASQGPSKSTGLSKPSLARDHARSMHGTTVRNMPTLPISAARDVPTDIPRDGLVWDETLGPGEYATRVLRRHTRLRIVNLDGDASVQLLVLNADNPIERLNVADIVKVQWNAYFGEGKLILSDMGRAMMSVVRDTCGNHDTFCGCSSERSNARRYGRGENHSAYPNARDRFLLGLMKHGLGKKDIAANLNLFKTVRIDPDGATRFVEQSSAPGQFVELRAEMNVLVALANTPHVLDDRMTYNATPARVLAWRGEPTPADDPIRIGTPEAQRAFENTDDLFNV